MLIDIFSERGYHAIVDVNRLDVLIDRSEDLSN